MISRKNGTTNNGSTLSKTDCIYYQINLNFYADMVKITMLFSVCVLISFVFHTRKAQLFFRSIGQKFDLSPYCSEIVDYTLKEESRTLCSVHTIFHQILIC